jgi:hypothetical protein
MLRLVGVHEVGALLLAAPTNHLQIRNGHVTVLGGFLVHTMLFCLFLCVFFHPVHFGMGDCACDRNRMPNVFAEFNAVALDLPSAPFLRCQQVFVGAVTVLKAACESPGAFCRRVVLRSRQYRSAGDYNQQNSNSSL